MVCFVKLPHNADLFSGLLFFAELLRGAFSLLAEFLKMEASQRNDVKYWRQKDEKDCYWKHDYTHASENAEAL